MYVTTFIISPISVVYWPERQFSYPAEYLKFLPGILEKYLFSENFSRVLRQIRSLWGISYHFLRDKYVFKK